MMASMRQDRVGWGGVCWVGLVAWGGMGWGGGGWNGDGVGGWGKQMRGGESTFIIVAPLSRACRLKTPQKVQLFLVPISFTISSIVQPYSCLYDTTSKGIWYCCSLRLTVSNESSRYPA